MKTLMSLRTLVMAALLCAAHATSFAQGPLNPPGPPMPTMKTLVEMEPRTHITSLPYTITASGSYYLTTNLNGGGAGKGIVVQASGVTIDLRGFTILNCTVGISAGPGVRGVTVHNGMVSGCTGTGIDLGAVNKVRLEDVIVCNNGGDGASVGSASIVTLCTAVANGARGLALDSGGAVFRCVAQSNSASGITVTSNCQVTDNTCERNGSGAGQAGVLTTGFGNRVEGNSCNDSAAHGFKIDGTGNLVIRNNACRNVAGDYAVSMGNNYGQVLVAPGAAFVNSNPWANFSCGTPPNGPCATDGSCDDGVACTTDVCDVKTGQCAHALIPNCANAVCGNNVLEGNEQCDDGNVINGDGCDNNCTPPSCGNGIVTAGEQCDDGNLINGDGCSAVCQIQCVTGAACTDGNPCTTGDVCVDGACRGTPLVCNDNNPCTNDNCSMGVCVYNPTIGVCDDGNPCTTEDTCSGGACIGGSPLVCNDNNPCTNDSCDGKSGACAHTVIPNCSFCGNNILEGDEQCDDGNLINGDGCSAVCSVQPGFTCVGTPSVCTTVCGDGIPAGGEKCDDGNLINGDGCSAVCQADRGFTCVGTPSVCTTVCGDGIPAGAETCDDGNLINSDGCSAVCQADRGFTCVGTPSVCTTVCGDGIPAGAETCDDGNLIDGDGCSDVCKISIYYTCAGSPSVCSQVTYLLTTARAGTGTGTIDSAPAGINCGVDCREVYNANTVVTLTATPAGGSTFAGWTGGGCSGTGTCTVTNFATSVTATFTVNIYQLTVASVGNGTGTVTSAPAGISCGGDCTEVYKANTVVTLTATPAGGSTFTGWDGGGCSGTGTCTVKMNSATSVTATFTLNIYQLTVAHAGAGTGTVTSAPAGINCGVDCTEVYNANTVVTLTATPAVGSTFAGWTGACTGKGTCQVTMNAARSVNATFTSP